LSTNSADVDMSLTAENTERTDAESMPPKKPGPKRKLWIMLIAVVVAAALVGTAAYVLLSGKDLGAKLTPEDIPNLAAGSTQALSVEVTWGSGVVTAEDGVTYSWSVAPSELGSFNYVARANVVFHAGTTGGEGTIECEVTYKGNTAKAEADVTVDPPFLDSVSIAPSSKTLIPGEEWSFTAVAVDSVGDEVTDATFAWSVLGPGAGDYTLTPTTGPTVTFEASVETSANLSVAASKGSIIVHGYASITVTTEVSVRTVDYYWYDLFGPPLGEWYQWREDIAGDEWAITDTYPYVYMNSGLPPGNTWIYTLMRMNVTGRNMTELSMNTNPEFLPYLGGARGGTAIIDWHMDYATYDYCEERLGAGPLSYYDGWYVFLNGTVSLDQQAAMAVLGITSTQYDDFDTWWSLNRLTVKEDWWAWLNNEAGNDRLAIFNAYEYDLDLYYLAIDAVKVGTDVQLSIDTIGWGLEALMFRWLGEAWMPVEYWMEDMDLHATIGPEMTNIDIDAAVAYAAYAYETTEEAEPCWAWEGMMQDYIESTPDYPVSLFDPYADFTYFNYAPGSAWYDAEMDWDYTPGAWNLSEGETLVLEWPAGDDLLYFAHDADGIDGDLVPGTIDSTAPMTVVYAEPMPSDAPEHISIDDTARTISYLGPFDMWTWSKDQTAHDWLLEEWGRLEMLPYGAPYVEFRPPMTGPPSLDLYVEDIRSPLEIGEVSSLNVTIRNSLTGDVYTDYEGTVTFESSDLAAVLPEDYTFDPLTDSGRHTFEVAFNTVDPVTHQATHFLTASDVDDATVSGTQSGILVEESPRVASFDVAFSGDDVIATEPTGFAVTAYNQWDEVYTSYDGTVAFESDDGGADLPADTAFDPGMSGVQGFSVTFSTPGLHIVNVSDVDVTEATGESSVTVLAAPVADHFILTGVEDPALVETDQTMTVTVYDQYDREFMAYEGTVEFETNRTGDVLLPGDETFTLGDSTVDVIINFTAEGYFTVWCNDTTDSSITGMLEAWTVGELPALDHFTVTGIEDMWENNYSSVTVTAYDQYDSVFEDYVGEITFSTDAPGLYELPDDYTFVPADNGVAEFPDSVMFDEPGTFDVEVEDTSDDTKNGVQEDIVIEDLVADLLSIFGPSTVMENETFGVTVVAYHQYGEAYEEYNGEVTFESSDTSIHAILPEDYEFVPADMGSHGFSGLSLSEIGPQTLTVTDIGDGALTDTLDVEVTPLVTSSITYRIYDMFEEPWHGFWDWRVNSATWDTERLLTSDPGNVTYLYSMSANPNGNNDQGTIYAPYRWNVTAVDIDYVNVSAPEFMPTFGPEIAGAEASVHVNFNYIHPYAGGWWETYWIPTWGDHPDWPGDDFADGTDGYWMATLYDVTMNRAAAEKWMDLPTGTSPADWWAANEASYVALWRAWLDVESSERLDIYNAYEDIYHDFSTMMRLTGDETSVHLKIAHVSAGYEILMTRWLLETGISPHQAYFEDFNMTVDYSEDKSDLVMDTVCQWSLRSVKANASTAVTGAPGAWAWEPTGLDYLPASISHPDSQFTPYYYLTYQSWNSGDPAYSTERDYEGTPWALSLPGYAQLVIELPQGNDVIGYHGQIVDGNAVKNVWGGDTSDYDEIRYLGSMEPGTSILSDLPSEQIHYDEVGKILTISGPHVFDNPRGEGLLYHGAPWLEFNVTETTAMASAAASPSQAGFGASPEDGSVVPAGTSAGGAFISVLAFASIMALAAVTVAAGRVGRATLDINSHR
jgi:flagellar basal body-associated protein FliL